MFTLKVGKAEQYEDIEQRETRLRVPFAILKPVVDEQGDPLVQDGEPVFDVMTERIESFPLGTSIDEVRETLQRHLAVYTEDYQRYESAKVHQAQLDEAQEVADEISNITL